MTIVFTVGKVQARSYLEHQPEFVRDLAEQCAKAFVRGRNRKELSKKVKTVSVSFRVTPQDAP